MIELKFNQDSKYNVGDDIPDHGIVKYKTQLDNSLWEYRCWNEQKKTFINYIGK
jgi:hypothetical protein